MQLWKKLNWSMVSWLYKLTMCVGVHFFNLGHCTFHIPTVIIIFCFLGLYLYGVLVANVVTEARPRILHYIYMRMLFSKKCISNNSTYRIYIFGTVFTDFNVFGIYYEWFKNYFCSNCRSHSISRLYLLMVVYIVPSFFVTYMRMPSLLIMCTLY